MTATEVEDWADYQWPDWVPQRNRELIAKFWGAHNGRKPSDYDKSWMFGSDNHPPMGSIVRCKSDAHYYRDFDASREPIEGRWVPTWNNMCVVVLPDGEVKCRSTCGIIEYISTPTKCAVCKCDGAVAYSGDKGHLCRFPDTKPVCRFCGQPWAIFLGPSK